MLDHPAKVIDEIAHLVPGGTCHVLGQVAFRRPFDDLHQSADGTDGNRTNEDGQNKQENANGAQGISCGFKSQLGKVPQKRALLHADPENGKSRLMGRIAMTKGAVLLVPDRKKSCQDRLSIDDLRIGLGFGIPHHIHKAGISGNLSLVMGRMGEKHPGRVGLVVTPGVDLVDGGIVVKGLDSVRPDHLNPDDARERLLIGDELLGEGRRIDGIHDCPESPDNGLPHHRHLPRLNTGEVRLGRSIEKGIGQAENHNQSQRCRDAKLDR